MIELIASFAASRPSSHTDSDRKVAYRLDAREVQKALKPNISPPAQADRHADVVGVGLGSAQHRSRRHPQDTPMNGSSSRERCVWFGLSAMSWFSKRSLDVVTASPTPCYRTSSSMRGKMCLSPFC